MRLKNILIVVDDIEKSKKFYQDLFGLLVIRDFGENVILTEGLVLQERKTWEESINKDVTYGRNDAVLYFEENDMDTFLDKLEKSAYKINYINPCFTRNWGQRVIRFYDPNQHIIEIGESMEAVIRRLLKEGLSVVEVAKKTRLPMDVVENSLGIQ